MSGLIAFAPFADTGFPPFTIWKWVPPTSRATKIAALPCTCSDQTTQGTVG